MASPISQDELRAIQAQLDDCLAELRAMRSVQITEIASLRAETTARLTDAAVAAAKPARRRRLNWTELAGAIATVGFVIWLIAELVQDAAR